MWMSIQSWPTCPSSPRLNWSLVHLYDPNSTPRRPAPMGQVHTYTHICSQTSTRKPMQLCCVELSSWSTLDKCTFYSQIEVSPTGCNLRPSHLQSHWCLSGHFMNRPFCLPEGVEPVGNVVMKKAVFTVETISAGMGEVLVYVEDPAGHREEVRQSLGEILSLIFLVVMAHHHNFIIPSCRLKWQPTMIRTEPTLSSTSLKSQACTR